MLLTAKKPPDELKIINIGPEESGKALVRQTGSLCFWHGIKINLNVYDRSGIGIPERQYYCVDEGGNISLKLKSLSGSIFHEFTHCLHYAEGGRTKVKTYDVWDTREERRTISGYIDPGGFDPICDNCFHLYDSIVHGAPYMPRIGHCGYRSDTPPKTENKKREELRQFYSARNFDIVWPNRYVIK
jgi:hypothetical protein